MHELSVEMSCAMLVIGIRTAPVLANSTLNHLHRLGLLAPVHPEFGPDVFSTSGYAYELTPEGEAWQKAHRSRE